MPLKSLEVELVLRDLLTRGLQKSAGEIKGFGTEAVKAAGATGLAFRGLRVAIGAVTGSLSILATSALFDLINQFTQAEEKTDDLTKALDGLARVSGSYALDLEKVSGRLVQFGFSGEEAVSVFQSLSKAIKSSKEETSVARAAFDSFGVEAIDKTTGRARSLNAVLIELFKSFEGRARTPEFFENIEAIFGQAGVQKFGDLQTAVKTITGQVNELQKLLTPPLKLISDEEIGKALSGAKNLTQSAEDLAASRKKTGEEIKRQRGEILALDKANLQVIQQQKDPLVQVKELYDAQAKSITEAAFAGAIQVDEADKLLRINEQARGIAKLLAQEEKARAAELAEQKKLAEEQKKIFDEIARVRKSGGLAENLSQELKLFKQINQEARAAQEIVHVLTEGVADGLANAIQDVATRTATAKEAFRSFALSIIADINRILIRFLVLKAIGALIPGGGTSTGVNLKGAGATGGVIGGLPSLALGKPPKGYARGGVATEPTFLVGEGGQAEAVVPLPDNRSIPVKLSGPGAGGQTNVNVTIQANDTDGFDRLLQKRRKLFHAMVQDVIDSNPAARANFRSI